MNEALRSIWSNHISAEEEEHYRSIGLGQPVGGGDRAALLVIDVQNRTIDERYAASCGQAGARALPHVVRLYESAVGASVPVFFPYVSPKTDEDSARFATKFSSFVSIDASGYDFPRELPARPGDILVPKKHPSAFFGTSLTSYLIERGVDTVVLAGATTSGCVRASAVDAFSLGFRVLVPHQAVFDRSASSHAVNLFDINAKYADVMETDAVVDYFARLSERRMDN